MQCINEYGACSAQRAWLPDPKRVCGEKDEPLWWGLRAPKPRAARRGRRSGGTQDQRHKVAN